MIFTVTSVSFEDIQQCASYGEGNKLMYKLSVATSSLNPPHQYAPWVTVNGKHSENATDDLRTFLCTGPLKDVPECKGGYPVSPIIEHL